MKKKRIYKDFNDWWSHGNHGWTSASRDVAKAIWADFEPTILATRDDYTELMLLEVREMHERYVEHLRDICDYVKEHNLEALVGTKLFRWVLDRKTGVTPRRSPKFYSYKGVDYAVVEEVMMKHPANRQWVKAYKYINRDDPFTVYIREKSEFEERFTKEVD
jgi:hypothetical protein